VAGLFAGVVISNIFGFLWLALSGDLDRPDALTDAPLEVIALLQLGLVIGLLGGPAWATYRKGARSFAVDFGWRFNRRDPLLGLGAGLGTQIVLIPLLYVPIRWLVDDADDLGGPARELAERAHGAGILLLIVSVVVVAPVAEELFFRGLLLRALHRRFGSVVAIVGSSVVFGLVHFQLLQFPALMVVGVVNAVLTLRTGRLGPAVCAHVAFNAAAVAVQFVVT
jgi:membrane protease YdiL (CAAX protease family)